MTTATDTIQAMEQERSHYATRAERIRALVRGNPMQYGDRLPQAEYAEGVVWGLDIAIGILNG